ncbi:LLM class flavin-dependent oxidoreductase [Hansschlegelia plantiphila]|uniref:N5,N10-methylene tetrahydromethanopterin reductase n=1 Tax=Hansschlegelia plantiphila TaxID=374655 RepID=A0A9W6MWR2_9HYPH|nr:LLM class flavin-dependent oxidoreductase [Hansschlegelia plantiphila]GLK69087.1 N5,N10-methylene tetrahydromethanopterin reductase [Hansschlegelia plantiphila]
MKKAHLLGFIQHGVNSHATGMWRHPKDKVGWSFARPPYWEHMARTMERGFFDAMFIADELAPYNSYRNSSDATVKWAVQCPTHEPSTIAPIVTGATTHLGVGVTLSTAFEHPYSMCRRLSSLDHLSGGRIAWNIVGSYSKSEWDAYGAPMDDRSRRYDRIEEYVELCKTLWDSWEPDAIVADRGSGIYADPTKVREIVHDGEFFRCHGRHFVAPSPQGHPVLWQAGSSDRGRDFAAKHAEAIFAIHPDIAGMKAYSEDLSRRVVDRFGRPENSVKLIYGVQPIVAETRSEAEDKYAFIRSLMPPEGSMAMLSGQLSVDFSLHDPEALLDDVAAPGIQGVKDALVRSGAGEEVTLREAAETYSSRFAMPALVGTATDIVDQLETFMDEGGADGFMLLATYTPGCFEEFADLVSPEMQRRGRLRTAYAGRTLRDNLLQD